MGDVLITARGKRALVLAGDAEFYNDTVHNLPLNEQATVVDRVPEVVRAVSMAMPSGMLHDVDVWRQWGRFALDAQGRLTKETKAILMRVAEEVPGHLPYSQELRNNLYGSLVLMEEACTSEETS